MSDSIDKQEHFEDVESKLIKCERMLAALKSRRDTRLEIAEEYQEYLQGVREVLRAKNRNILTGIHGVVAELLHVPEQYEIAIENLLGSAVQHIIVQTTGNAQEAINYLMPRQLGRAAFLPLDLIRGTTIPLSDQASVSQSKGVIGIAVDLVSFDAKYGEIFTYLLGNAIVVETMEDAIRISARFQNHYHVVTLQGDLVNIGGLIIGGVPPASTKKLLGQKRIFSDIEADIRNVELEIATLKSLAKSSMSQSKTYFLKPDFPHTPTRSLNESRTAVHDNDLTGRIVLPH
ncbi:hypothetical protein [Paenibacillus periandrae]|uniref:hypothetical protein n=1 Tax=Paenibacillus periandrae TaxID=1761741 RepID=UPI001F098AE9|nr:hypothetical protein [Paenibacillus periandrae]